MAVVVGESGAEQGREKRDRKVYVARAEMILSRDDIWPLREVPLKPDPLTPFAYAFAELRDDLGDTAEVHLDLLPVSRGAIARRRRRATAELGRGGEKSKNAGGGTGNGFVEQVMVGLGHGSAARKSSPRVNRAEGVARLDELDRERTLAKSLRVTDPHFQMQVLVRTQSEIKGRPQLLIQSFVSCFEQWGDENYLRVRGRRVLGRYLAADALWNRALFDRRLDQVIFRPGRRSQIVSAAQIGGLIKPATVHCAATNVVRTGGVVPAPPRTLPTFTPQSRHLMPWGIVSYDESERLVGVHLDETFFTWTGGRSRYGKTETALCRFVHTARAGHGCLFLDPHADALARVKPHLVGEADRVIELSIARGSGSGRQVGWNPFSMAGCSREEIEDKAAAIVDSFAAAMNWFSAGAPRALTLMQNSTLSLLELSHLLPDDIAPTLFQMTTLLSDEDWREAVLPKLSPSLQSFWVNRFPRMSEDAITPVTNVVDRMRGSDSIAALLGSSRSTYNLREAMDDGKIVLVRLRGTGQIDQLMASFVVYDLLRAVLSRWDTPPDQRPPLHAYMDEVQSYDHSVRGLLASALEEGGKFGLRVHLMNQQPTRLSTQTLNAILTNRSHLMSTNLGYESARLMAKEWQGLVTPETIQELGKYEFITQVTWRGETTTPFRARGLLLEDMYGEGASGADLRRLERAIDRNSGRRPIRDTLDELAHLDQRIVDYLQSEGRVTPIRSNGNRSRNTASSFRPDQVRNYGHSGRRNEEDR